MTTASVEINVNEEAGYLYFDFESGRRIGIPYRDSAGEGEREEGLKCLAATLIQYDAVFGEGFAHACGGLEYNNTYDATPLLCQAYANGWYRGRGKL